MKYNHTQIGYLIVVMLSIVLLMFLSILIQLRSELEAVGFFVLLMVVIVAIVSSFVSLNVSIDSEYIRLKFGYGLIRKKFKLSEIASAKTVRNKWYYGWGVRVWLFPKMIIFNVSGFDAVELQMKNGSIFRIGTDEPEKLKNAISQNINSN